MIDKRKSKRSHSLQACALGVVFAVMGAGIAHSQAVAPNADRDAMYAHFKKAQQIAGWDLFQNFARRCLISPIYSSTIANTSQAAAPIEPLKVTDNLYFVGQNAVSSWALVTTEGIVIFDTLNSPDEAKTYIEGGLVKLGLDPAKIKYVLVTHEHGDHFAGANYLKEKFGARIMASKIAWDAMAKSATQPRPTPPAARGSAAPARSGPPADWAKLVPAHDMELADGQKMVLGNTTLTFYVTPGHAQGTISTIFNTTDQGAPHIVGFHGGLGAINDPAMRPVHTASLARWRKLTQAAGVDLAIANHQVQDGAVEKLEVLRMNRKGDPNPFVLGKEGYLRFIDIQTECTYYMMARAGQKIE